MIGFDIKGRLRFFAYGYKDREVFVWLLPDFKKRFLKTGGVHFCLWVFGIGQVGLELNTKYIHGRY